MSDIQEFLHKATRLLDSVSSSPRLDVEVLLAHVLGKDRLWILTHLSDELPDEKAEICSGLLARRALYEPVAYLTGEKEFFGLPFFVNEHVLIPRPDSELLIEQASLWLQNQPKKDETFEVLDLGTGSGCLLVALGHRAREFGRSVRLLGVDVCAQALEVAQSNLVRHNLQEIGELKRSHWFSEIAPQEQFHIILANPPYIDHEDPERSPETDFEPRSALFADDQGMQDIKHILLKLPGYLRPEGILCMECGHTQAELIEQCLDGSGTEIAKWGRQWVRDIQDIRRALILHRERRV